MLRWFATFTCVFLLAPTTPAAEAPPGQWIVVVAPAYRKAVEPLGKHRKAQGLRVRVVQTTEVLTPRELRTGDAIKLRDHIHRLCKAHKGRSYVLLVGAIEAGGRTRPQQVVPALKGTISRMKGQPSDNAYGCPQGGRVPTVAVGRFPARTVKEVQAMVRKTLAYEEGNSPGTWRRHLTVLAGIPAYNPIVDRLVESLAMARFARLAPEWTGRAIYTNPASRFCVPDERLRKQALEYVQQGQAFILYLGHSYPLGLYGGRARFLDRADWANLKIKQGPGVFITFGCNGCQLKGKYGEGYGVSAMRNAQGPAAVIGSHGICFAAMVQLAADGLFQSTFTGKVPDRLGESWLALQEGVARGKINDFTYRLLDSVDGDSRIPQKVQRQEHLEMFQLLGDPALRLPWLPNDLKVDHPQAVTPDTACTVRGTLPSRLTNAKVRVTLERRITSKPTDLAPVPAKAGPERDRILQANHQRANHTLLASAAVASHKGKFVAKLKVPGKLPWPKVIVRVYASSGKTHGQYTVVLPVRPGKKKKDARE